MEEIPRRARAVVIVNDRLLVIDRIKHGARYTTLPGGLIEPGELPKDAVAREVREETSLTVTPLRPVYTYHDEAGSQELWLCRYESGQPQLPDDAPERESMDDNNLYLPGWLALADVAASRLMPEALRWRLANDAMTDFPKIVAL